MIRHQWLLIVVVAAGLVGMHHLVPAHTAHPMPTTMASATLTEHAHPATLVAATSTLVSNADCCDPMNDIVGHFCLAVVAAITALAGAMIFAAARRRALEPGYLLAAVSAVAARAPPFGCARFTQLCVLRR